MNEVKCPHVWVPKIIFSSLIYIRECGLCGAWSLRNKIEEWKQYDEHNKDMKEFIDGFIDYSGGFSNIQAKY
jgi:hypothetical protein